MVKRLARHGNSMALVLDKPVLELLKIGPDTPLEVSTNGTVLIVAPVRDRKRRAKFHRALDMANRRYGAALRRLAE